MKKCAGVAPRPNRAFCLVFLLASLSLVLGCGGESGGPKNEVTGKVTLNDKVVAGTVVFVLANGKEAKCVIGPDGAYSITEIVPGQAKVYIEPPAAGTGLVQMKDKAGKAQEMPKDGPGTAGTGVAPPVKYRSAATSELAFEIKTGKQTYDIPLK